MRFHVVAISKNFSDKLHLLVTAMTRQDAERIVQGRHDDAEELRIVSTAEVKPEDVNRAIRSYDAIRRRHGDNAADEQKWKEDWGPAICAAALNDMAETRGQRLKPSRFADRVWDDQSIEEVS